VYKGETTPASALQESEEQLRQLANNIPQVFWIFDQQQNKTIYISPACERIFGVTADELKNHPRSLIRAIYKEDRRRVHAARTQARAHGYDETFRIVRADGSVRWVHDRAFPVEDDAGSPYRLAGIAEDVTERIEANDRLTRLAHFDVLTGLPNRLLLHDRLYQALEVAKRNGWIMAVMFVDIDRFKYVNDTLGHDAGDRLLQAIAARLSNVVRSEDTVGRLGGDEFAVVLAQVGEVVDAANVATKLLHAIREPLVLNGTGIVVSGSIGITLYPQDGIRAECLLKNADSAMYRAKELGRDTYQYYKPEMTADALEIMKLENGLRGALERNEFVLHYQPKISVATRQIVGAEALIRWQHPERGLLAPTEFMAVLENCGLVVPVGKWVFLEVCRQMAVWLEGGGPVVPVSVNLSARQLLSPNLGPFVRQTLQELSIDPRLIEFEITETSVMKNPEEAIRTLEYLRSLGVRLAVDDFGTGYSSLSCLKRLPVHTLKIDRSFIQDIPTDADDVTITLAITSMARSLDLTVVAEGVETQAQLDFLQKNNCDEVQGHLFSRALPATSFNALLSEGANTDTIYVSQKEANGEWLQPSGVVDNPQPQEAPNRPLNGG
jgi:diguanylate cyclase (GGDEF)-like protein/PAS domain S-box-containing protein